MNEFEETERTMAFAPALLGQLGQLRGAFASEAKDGLKRLPAMLTHHDDTERTRTRAATFPGTVAPTPLSDGRIAVTGLWSRRIIAAWKAGQIAGEELSAEQLETLRVKQALPRLPGKK